MATLPAGFEIEQPGAQAQALTLPQGFEIETQETVAPRQIGRPGRAQQIRTGRTETQDLLRRFEAGEITSADLTPEQVESVRRARIEAIPEISQVGIQPLTGTEGLEGLGTAAIGLTTFDPAEFGKILTEQFPQIGISTTPDGEQIAVNNETGAVASLNKPGISPIDILQGLGVVAAFTPGVKAAAAAPAAVSGLIGREVAAPAGVRALAGGLTAAGTEAGIQAAQEAAGGTFDKEQVALAGGLGAVAEAVVPAAQAALGKTKGILGVKAPKATQTAEEGLKEVAKTVSKQKPAENIELVNADPRFIEAIDELQISSEPLASFASRNPQFRSVEQGLATIPGSQLGAQSKQFIGEVSKKADDLIVEYGGTLDKAALSDRFRQESITSIEDLATKADDLYDSLKRIIPARTPVNATNTVAFLEAKIADLGGPGKAPALLNKILGQLKVTEKKGRKTGVSVITGKPIFAESTTKLPTHERLNQTRKDIGEALNKGTGEFRKQSTGLLKALYKRLRSDQDAVAEGIEGAGQVSTSANALVRQRKHIEDNLSKLLGKDLEGSILPKVGQALKRLSKGEIQKWDSMMNRIPNKSMRQEIVVSSLNDIFSGANLEGKSLNPTQFSKFMDDLNRSPAIKNRLYKELPEESIRALENLGVVSRGISVALQDRIPTGLVASLFDNQNGFLRKLMGAGIGAAVTRISGPLAGGATREFMNQTTGGAVSAATVLSSPKFQNMIRQAVKEGVTDASKASAALKKSENIFKKSPVFKKWIESLSNSERSEITKSGPISYLLGKLPTQTAQALRVEEQ